MGTNYYLVTEGCGSCGRGQSELHIGKSSYGWCFSLNTHPFDGIACLEDWKERWSRPGTFIRDENHQTIAPDSMLSTITERVGARRKSGAPLGYSSLDEFYTLNSAERGPGNLLRHRVDGNHCIAHGDGTFDYMRGEFC